MSDGKSDEDDVPVDLANPNFKRGQLAGFEQTAILNAFSAEISGIEATINDGKEATVYLCQNFQGEPEFVCAKVFRARKFRAFQNNTEYINTHKMRDRRVAKAIRRGSRAGRSMTHHLWIEQEWNALNTLYDAGASVPQPIRRSDQAILMEFIDHEGQPAPLLADLRLHQQEAERLYDQVIRDIETLLECNLVHGDLSPFNILYQSGRVRMIDVPQALDITTASDPWTLFYRDIDHVVGYFRKFGVDVDPLDVALKLWR